MHQKQLITYTTKTLAVGILSVISLWVFRTEPAKAQFGEGCNIYGCSKSPGVECNPFGCPNPGAGACDSMGCPSSPANKPDDSNSSDNSNRPISGECMDRVMFREVQAISSDPVPSGVHKGDYEYNLPSDIPNDAIRQADFSYSSSGTNWNSQPVVKIRLKSPEEAAKACR